MNESRVYRRAVLASAVVAAIGSPLATAQQPANQQKQANQLEEVIVTAQKREQSLQSAPIAISALTTTDLQKRGILGLSDLTGGAIPTLKVEPFPNNPSSLIISIRGIGQADAAQATKELATGIYLDGVYLGRAQGLGFDVVDPQRIEVLRGPQGALYGRNSIGGAINLVSKKPNDQFSLRQTFGYGKYGDYKSLSQVNVPITDNFFAKVSYLYNKRDGWVKNAGSSGDNYNQIDKHGGRAAFRWEPSDSFTVDYAFDWSSVQTTMNYFQFARIEDVVPGLPYIQQATEPDRQDKTRFPLYPMKPSDTDTRGHTLTLTWNLSPNNTLKYIGAYRSLNESTYGNYGGVFLVGLAIDNQDSQDQLSHELQLVGSAFDGQFDYVAGLYYYHEDVQSDAQNLESLAVLDQNGVFFGPALPYIQIPLQTIGQPPIPLGDFRRVNGDSESRAVYTQLTWRPPAMDSKLAFTLGMRYTKDTKHYQRLYSGNVPVTPQQKVSLDDDNFSPTFTVSYDFTDTLNAYAKWANGYRAGGVNLRSASFRQYGEDKVESWELGLKSQWLDNRLRANVALFDSTWKDAQIDFSDPVNISISETINARDGNPKIKGAELDLTALLFSGFTASFDYQYLSWNFPNQLNPLSGNFERFVLPQAPKNSASLNLDYELPSFSFGTLGFHADANYTSDYYYTPQNYDKGGSRTLINGRISLSDIPVGLDGGSLQVALWGKNLTDREWVTYSIQSAYSLSKAYGMPRSYGIDVTFRYN